MSFQKELSEKAAAALILPADPWEASVSKVPYNLVGALSNEPLVSWLLSLLRSGCNHLAKCLTQTLEGGGKTKIKERREWL